VTENPYLLAEWELADAAALQSVARGTASEAQQKRALDWVLTRAAMTYEETFVPGKPDMTGYLAGRRSVGLQIRKLLAIDTSAIAQAKKGKQ
jgi:hypothetical protein